MKGVGGAETNVQTREQRLQRLWDGSEKGDWRRRPAGEGGD